MKKILYNILEVFFTKGMRVTISGVSLKLPFRFYRYYEKDYEADNIRFFRETIKPGDVVLDIGAQIGLMTKFFSELAGSEGKVYAFEPTPHTFGILKKTILLNQIENIAVPVQQAVTDKKGKAIFHISQVEIDASNSLADLKRPHPVNGIEVEVTTIDDFVKEHSVPKINFIKVDAEGAEYNVLAGAATTLAAFRPVINLALHPLAISNFNSSLEKIYDWIQSKNYVIMYKFKPISKADFISKTDLFDVQLFPVK